MLVSWPLELRDMDSAGGDGSSDWSSDSGSPATAWECRRSLASSWDGSWYLQAAGEGTAGCPPPGLRDGWQEQPSCPWGQREQHPPPGKRGWQTGVLLQGSARRAETTEEAPGRRP